MPVPTIPLPKSWPTMSATSTGSPVAISQKAAAVALTAPQDQVETMRQAFEERRNYIVERDERHPRRQLH